MVQRRLAMYVLVASLGTSMRLDVDLQHSELATPRRLSGKRMGRCRVQVDIEITDINPTLADVAIEVELPLFFLITTIIFF